MRTRRGTSYPIVGAPVPTNRKRAKLTTSAIRNFDALPDDIVSSILVKLGSTADCPADFVVALLTCKRFNCLGLNPVVLSQAASPETFAVKYTKWSPEAQRFLQRCADAGNAEASYTLGMIQFYCCCNHRTGAALMAKAALKSHASALYSLAIIQFNGSGSSKFIKDLTGGVTLCARAAFLGHLDAIRELGHCLKDGYGISKNISEGERLLVQANARELAVICSTPELIPGPRLLLPPYPYCANGIGSDLRFSLLPRKCHPANRFLAGWNRDKSLYSGYRICSYVGCGRLETRMHEFRRCSVCGVMNYCSRGCQARDWTLGHNRNCRPMVRFANVNVNGAGAGAGGMW
ncbi:putative F-box protein [Helianthus debilis subsp. tardiflorus]